MIANRIQRAGIRLVLLAALFAQIAVAANACLTPSAMRAQLAAAAVASHCDQSQEINLNLCLYQTADQTYQSEAPVVVAAPVAAVLTVPHAVPCVLPSISPLVTGNAGHDPPIPIRFCSFLI